MTAGSEGSPVFDYTSLDFTSVELDLIRYAISTFPEDLWTDLNESNEGRRLIELVAYATDLLAYTGNQHSLEVVVASLIREQNFRNAAKTFDFTLKSAAPSRVPILRFTLDIAFLPVFIPATFKVADASTLIFQPDVDGTATLVTYDVAATQGDETVLELMGVSDGSSGQKFDLANTPLIDKTQTITVGGATYVKITNFIEVGPTDEVYILETTEAGVTTVIFGDNINGKIPPLGQDVEATYKVGGGTEGNLPAGAISTLVSSIPGVLSVVNITAAENGGPKQSLTSGKRQLPLSIKANERAVTTQDFASEAVNLVTGVFKATGVTGLFQAGGAPVILFIVPNGVGDLTPSLANDVVNTLRFGTGPQDPGVAIAGRAISPRTAIYVNLLITVDTFVQQGSSSLVVGNRVQVAMTNRYDPENVSFAEALDLQDAYNTVDPAEQGIDGLSRVFIRQFSIEPFTGRFIPSPTTGNGVAEGIAASVTAERREWNIRILPAGGPAPSFNVFERRLGTISGLSDTSLEDDAASYDVDELETGASGYRLHVNEQLQAETFTIAANSQSSITVSGVSSPGGIPGLLTLATPGDSYVAERLDSVTGLIFRALVTAPATAAQPVVTVDNLAAFSPGDLVLVRDSLSNSIVLTVLTAIGFDVTFTTDLPFALAVNDTLDWFWQSSNGTVGFALIQGTSSFVDGDTLYVDVYPEVGDIKLRPENFPLLDENNLIIKAIGGVS